MTTRQRVVAVRSRTTRGRVVRDHSLRTARSGRFPWNTDTVAADLIEYLIVEVPDLDALASLVPALVELVATRQDPDPRPRRAGEGCRRCSRRARARRGRQHDGAEGRRRRRRRHAQPARHRTGVPGASARDGGHRAGHRGSVGGAALRRRATSRAARSSAASASRPPGSSPCSPTGPTITGQEDDDARRQYVPQPSVGSAGPAAVRCPNVRGQREGWIVDPVEQLAELADLLSRGLLSRDEFEHHKAKVIDASGATFAWTLARHL